MLTEQKSTINAIIYNKEKDYDAWKAIVLRSKKTVVL